MPDLTVPDNFEAKTSGYILIAPLDNFAKKKISDLQNSIASKLPSDSLWLPRNDQLHITFAHAITPEVEYLEDREKLFRNLEPDVRKCLKQIVHKNLCVKISFRRIAAFQSAIILIGKDDGTFGKLRYQFTSNVNLPEQTRRPPEIIHTTIARYHKPLNLKEVSNVVDEFHVDLNIKIKEIDLIHEKKIYVQDHEVLERYPVGIKLSNR